MIKDIAESVNNQPIKSVKKLGIDEIALRKGKHDYCAVLVDLENSKYVLLKKGEDLTETEKKKLKEVYENFPKLRKMYGQKERIRRIYESAKNCEEGLEEIGKWLNRVKDLFPKSSKTIINWIGEIVSYFDNRTTQGKVEGINNKIKLVKRLAYGFRNFNSFCVRVFLDWYFKTDLAY